MSLGEWVHLLELGWLYGWKARGTVNDGFAGRSEADIPSCIPSRTTNYESNDWQIVDREDAAALASAIKNALDDVPDDSQNRFTRDAKGALDDWQNPFPYVEPQNVLESFAGRRKTLRDFISFLRRGEFRIG